MITCSRCRVAALCLGNADLELFTITNNDGSKEVIVHVKCRSEHGFRLALHTGNAPWECPRKSSDGVNVIRSRK